MDHPIIRFLQRNNDRETWEYERPVILAVELLCLIAGAWAAPTRDSMLLMLVSMPLVLWGAELARAERSGAARKTEQMAALGLPLLALTCEADMVRVAKNKQLLNATAPIVTLSAAVAAAGFAGITRAIVVGFVVSVVRWAMVEAYGTWRAWYRSHVPVQVCIRNERTSS